jgi:hypothetical protein
LSIAVAMVLGLLLPSRQANASGCHAAERPTLGLSLASEIDPDSSVHAALPHLARTPCSSETPGSFARSVTLDLHAAAPVFTPQFCASEPRAFPFPQSIIPTEPTFRIDRPPRLDASV